MSRPRYPKGLCTSKLYVSMSNSYEEAQLHSGCTSTISLYDYAIRVSPLRFSDINTGQSQLGRSLTWASPKPLRGQSHTALIVHTYFFIVSIAITLLVLPMRNTVGCISRKFPSFVNWIGFWRLGPLRQCCLLSHLLKGFVTASSDLRCFLHLSSTHVFTVIGHDLSL